MMLPNAGAIYLANFSVDMRKSIDGLSLLVCNHFNMNPADGAIYVFINRASNKIKMLYFDRNGFVLWYKRLERGKFKFLANGSGMCELEESQLRWLLDGLDFSNLRGHSQLNYNLFC